MKHSLLALSLATLATTQAFAANTANLVLNGVVEPVLNIEVQPTALASALPLDKQQDDQKVATLLYSSNSVSGFKLLARSKNSGKLINDKSNNHHVTYSLKHGGQAIGLSAGDTEFFKELNNRGSWNKDITITYGKPVDLASGTYTDTVTFTIMAN